LVRDRQAAIREVSAYREGELSEAARSLRRSTHRTIERVTNDLSTRYQANTAIAALMEHLNALSDFKADSAVDRAVLREGVETLVVLLSPFAPHIADELNEQLGGSGTLLHAGWPSLDRAALHEAMVEIPVQINGKVRARVSVARGASEEVVLAAAKDQARVQAELAGKTLRKVVFVPDKILTLVVG
jgi:leucyl-tRNA synthetase